ncbi:ricin-type beta-trefoil lectin domain protein [Streptomyces sp. DSM 44915]|uniref:Ricin-type beta-trefoil lectin domain protein n=1 Tax=Streptomyces chisholmiae TaxID=3075540 RepID=A0ABU2JL32_9ACTN|nr:ricin-type beta-trefoil lectin domain protein [Streptomyces sp. DSM 44915]MDT0265691.1 ricin-type beta-trefoil lectin domain protein [Streptomyces sp. DSM 44915]
MGGVGPLRPGDPRDIAGYVLEGRLGEGGMGTVYRSATRGGQPIALKAVHPSLTEDPRFRRRFEREVRAARRVRGRYLVPVVDSNTEGAVPWLATEYVPGPSLAQAVAEHGPLPLTAALRLTAGVAHALDTIHAAGVIHRDLKPGNVLLADDGPAVIDFGIARAAEATPLTGTDTRIGTPTFMAPEQVRGTGEMTPALDVFALGLTAQIAATGAHPFGTGPVGAVLYRIDHQDPRLDETPAALLPLVRACLAKEPADRPTPERVVALCREALDELGDEQAVLPTTGWLPAGFLVPPAAPPATPPPAPPPHPPLPPTAVVRPAVPAEPPVPTARDARVSVDVLARPSLPPPTEPAAPAGPGPAGPPGGVPPAARTDVRRWWPVASVVTALTLAGALLAASQLLGGDGDSDNATGNDAAGEPTTGGADGADDVEDADDAANADGADGADDQPEEPTEPEPPRHRGNTVFRLTEEVCLDGGQEGSVAYAGACNGGRFQVWEVFDDGTLRNQATQHCLTDAEQPLTLGCDGGEAQRWEMTETAGALRNLGTDRCLVPFGLDFEVGLAPCSGDDGQRWVASAEVSALRNVATGWCLHARDAAGACDAGSGYQQWEVAGDRAVRSVTYNQCLDVGVTGYPVPLGACHAELPAEQQWARFTEGPHFVLRSHATGQCLAAGGEADVYLADCAPQAGRAGWDDTHVWEAVGEVALPGRPEAGG